MYSELQKNLAAQYLARAGMNVSAAVKALQDEEESFGSLGENTLRGWLKDAEFSSLVAAHTTALREAQLDAAREAERSAFQRKLAGSRLELLQQMEDESWALFKRLQEKFEDPSTPKKDLFIFWKQAHAFTVALRQKHGAVLTTAWETELLVQAFVAELNAAYGNSATDQIVERVNEAWSRAVIAHKAKLADDAQGESANAAKVQGP